MSEKNIGRRRLKKGLLFLPFVSYFCGFLSRKSKRTPKKRDFRGLVSETMMASRSARKVPVSFYPTTLGRLDVKLPFPPMWTFRRRRPVARLGFGSGDLASRSSLVRRRYWMRAKLRMNRRLAQSNLDLIAISRSRSSRFIKRAFCRQKKTRAPQRKRRRRKRRTVGISTLVASANSACNSSTVVDHGMLPTYKRLAGGEAGCCCSDIFFLSFFFFVFLAIFLCGILSFFLSMILGRRRKNNTKAKKTKARLSFDPFGKSLYLI